jgi:hypothetical protein
MYLIILPEELYVFLYASLSELHNFAHHFLVIFCLAVNVMSRVCLLSCVSSHIAQVDVRYLAGELLDINLFWVLVNKVSVFARQLFLRLTLTNGCKVSFIILQFILHYDYFCAIGFQMRLHILVAL